MIQPMVIAQMWPTPVAQQQIDLPEPMRKALIEVLKRKDAQRGDLAKRAPDFHVFMKDKGFYATSHYNLFDEADAHPEREAILMFERVACLAAREYLAHALELREARDVQLAGRCFGNVQRTGDRTLPHYHQGVDFVLVHYLTVGHGADVEASSTPRNGPHALLLLDPRPVPTFPYWEKVHAIQPRIGLTVLTPGYLWHETNPFRFDGDRVCIVVNFNVITNTYAELHRPMRF